MSETAPGSLLEHFADVTDPRVDRTKLHQLLDILVIAMCATICGAEGWEDFAVFGKAKQEWFETFLALPNGIPSPDTFRRVREKARPARVRVLLSALGTGREQNSEWTSCGGRWQAGARFTPGSGGAWTDSHGERVGV